MKQKGELKECVCVCTEEANGDRKSFLYVQDKCSSYIDNWLYYLKIIPKNYIIAGLHICLYSACCLNLLPMSRYLLGVELCPSQQNKLKS